jgi:hypothetical protein
MNVKFHYRYRDWGNFKNYGSVVFGNRCELAFDQIRQRIKSATPYEHSFVASRLKLPDLFFRDYAFDPELDHGFHEFFDVTETALPVNDALQRDIFDLLVEIDSQAVIFQSA